jgi:hypothetical protein
VSFLPVPAWRCAEFLYGNSPDFREQPMWSRLKESKGEIILATTFVLGVVFDIFGSWLRYTEPQSLVADIILEVGTALMIASVLAFTIELWMTKRIARDVFRAAFGYSMPEHFKEEIQRIADHRLICTTHRMYVNIELVCGEDAVRVTTNTYREIRNIGPGRETYAGSISVDEWGFLEKSQIIRCTISCDGQELSISPDGIERGQEFVKAETSRIRIKRKSLATIVSESVEIRRKNDDIMYGFGTPTENPLVHLTLPDNLTGRAEAGIPGAEDGVSPVIPHQYEFKGVYFPPSHMRVRWWPKADGPHGQP